MSLLDMQNITKSFAGNRVLHKVNLQVHKGEVHALMGENGAGKSTLMNILMGILKYDEGKILFDGQDVQFKNPKEALDHGISMIHQELHPVLDMTVAENIFIGREIRRGNSPHNPFIDKRELYKKCNHLLKQMDIPIKSHALMKDLSVAQWQLIEIVKAISLSSKIIIMDEPTSAISGHEVEILFTQIHKLRDQGVAIVYISHKMDEIFQIANRITVLRDGAFIGTDLAENLNDEKLIRMMVGREITEVFPKENVTLGEDIFAVKNFTWGKKFQDISFTLKKGEILGIAGLVGAGRSELVESIFGLHKGVTGEVFLQGKQVQMQNPSQAIARKIALITEDRKYTGLNLKGSVEENISLVSLKELFPQGVISKKKEEQFSEDYIRKLGIKTVSGKVQVSSLSGGNQQKVVLAKWLLSDPDIIIMDEPTRGIDIGAKMEVYFLINSLAKEGKSIIMISSEIPEIMGLCDRILVMAAGRFTGEIMRPDFSQELIMKYASDFKKSS